MVGILVPFWDGLFSGGENLLVSGSVTSAISSSFKPLPPSEAFAKVLGGYHRLKEGSTAWALGQMTGDQPRSRQFSVWVVMVRMMVYGYLIYDVYIYIYGI